MIEQQPFTKYQEKKETDTFTIRLNKHERQQLEADKKLIHQTKDGTTLKTYWQIGRYVLHDEKMRHIINTLFKNKANNQRLGIAEFE